MKGVIIMEKEKLIEQIISIVEKVEDKTVLKDIYNLVSTVYKHYKSGEWGR